MDSFRFVDHRYRTLVAVRCRVAVPAIIALALLASGCNSYFYWPDLEPPVPDPKMNLQIRMFESQDGTVLQGWSMPSRTGMSHGTVVYCHGADSNVGDYYEAAEFIPRDGFDLFLFDYRGYGGSKGSPTREGTILDTHAAIEYSKREPLFRPGPIILYGYSLGAGIAIVVASERDDIAGVIAESGFTSYREIGRKVVRESWKTWPFAAFSRILVSRGYDPIDYVDRISPRPLFLMHGGEDKLVPSEMSERLYAKAKEPKSLWIRKGGTHYDPPGRRHAEYERRVVGYLHYIEQMAKGVPCTVTEDCRPGASRVD